MAYKHLYNVRREKTRVGRVLSGRKAARGGIPQRARDPDPRARPREKPKRLGRDRLCRTECACSPQDHGTGVASLCAARKGGNPSRTFTVVSVRRQVGSKPPSLPFPPPPLSLPTNPSGTPTTDRWRERSRAAGCVLPTGPPGEVLCGAR